MGRVSAEGRCGDRKCIRKLLSVMVDMVEDVSDCCEERAEARHALRASFVDRDTRGLFVHGIRRL